MLSTVGMLSAQDNFKFEFITKTAFSVAGATLPAGTYKIRMVDHDENVFECQAKSGAPSVKFEANPHEVTPGTTNVTFAKYGDKVVLKNMSIAGDRGYWIATSIPEKHHKKGGVQPTTVATAAANK